MLTNKTYPSWAKVLGLFVVLIFGACQKHDFPLQSPEADVTKEISGVAEWYNSQLIHATSDTGFTSLPDWTKTTIKEVGDTRTFTTPVYTSGNVSRQLIVNLTAEVYTGVIKEYRKTDKYFTVVNTFSINGKPIEEGYTNITGGYHVTRTWQKDPMRSALRVTAVGDEGGGSGSGGVGDLSISDESDRNDNDGDWWNDHTTVTYPRQNLPSWSLLYAAYPRSGNQDLPAGTVYQTVGGTVAQLYNSDPINYGNACALRISRALNYSGITIPNRPNHTFLGGDGKYYFLSAAKLYNFLIQTFGGGRVVHSSAFNADFLNYQSVLGTGKAIYLMKPVSTSAFGATGHATLYNGTDCMLSAQGHDGKYLNPAGGLSSITLWTVY